MHSDSAHDPMSGAAPALTAPARCPAGRTWVKRLGAAAFLFFLVKGLLWLAIPAGIAAWTWWGR